jgi:type IV pilus assembly protein PilE
MNGLRRSGFSLVELMIVLAIVAILLAIAYPSFLSHIAKSRRADAKASLMQCAQMLERHATQTGHYLAGGDANVVAACTGTSKGGYYRLPAGNIPTAADVPGTFAIRADPVGAQASDVCGSLAYTQDGDKAVIGATLTAPECW